MSDPRATLRSYLRHVNDHDVEGALAHLAEDFRLSFPNGPELDRSAMESAMGWDAGTEGRVDWESIESEEPDEIAIRGQETNEFLRLLGIPPLPFRSHFRFDDAGLILRQRHAVEWPDPPVEEALAPAVAWAEVNEPETLAEIYPDGHLVYSEAKGRRWLGLLRRWRDATGDRPAGS